MNVRQMVWLRILCLVFVLSLSAGLLAACKTSGDNGTKTDAPSSDNGEDSDATDEWGQNRYDKVVPTLD